MRPAIQFSGRVTALILAVLWLWQTPLSAAIYKWKDDQGKTHFTDDKSNIPLKHRGQLEKFKGVTEPKVEIPEPEGEPEAFAEEEPGGQTPDPQAAAPKEPPPEPPLTPEEKAVMTAVYKPLMNVWGDHVSLVRDGEVTEKNLKQYVKLAQNSAANKKTIAKTIGKNQHPLLQEIKTFLKKTRRKDARLREDSSALMKRAKIYRKRLIKEIPIEKEFVDALGKKLKLQAPPLPTLAEEIAKAAKRRQIKKSSRKASRKKSSDSSIPAEFKP